MQIEEQSIADVRSEVRVVLPPGCAGLSSQLIELFELETDPGEKSDISGKRIGKNDELVRKLHQWIKEIEAPELKPNPNYSLED